MVATAGRAPAYRLRAARRRPALPRRRALRAEHCPEGPPARAWLPPGTGSGASPGASRGVLDDPAPVRAPYGPLDGRYARFAVLPDPGERVPEHRVAVRVDAATWWGAAVGVVYPGGAAALYRRRCRRRVLPGRRTSCRAGRGVRGTEDRRLRYVTAGVRRGDRSSPVAMGERRGRRPRGTRPWLPLLAPGRTPRGRREYAGGRRHEQLRSRTGGAAAGTVMGTPVPAEYGYLDETYGAPRALTDSTGAYRDAVYRYMALEHGGLPRCSRGVRGMYRVYRGAPREVRPGAAGQRDAVGGGAAPVPATFPSRGSPVPRSLDPERASPGSGTAIPGAYLDVETALPG